MIKQNLRPSFGALDALGHQQASWAKTFVVPDFSSVAPKFDLSKYSLPKLDLAAIDVSVLDAATRQMSESVWAGFDFGKFLPKIDFGNLLKSEPPGGWDRWWANWWPPNWPRNIDLDAMQSILVDDALPMVWVPRAEIVTEVLAAETREDRVAVLVARRAEVAEDCRAGRRRPPEAAAAASAARGGRRRPGGRARRGGAVARRAGGRDGGAGGRVGGTHRRRREAHEAVREGQGCRAGQPRRGTAVAAPRRRRARAGRRVLRAVLPHRGDPVPEGMSRHVTVHFAFDGHHTEEHAVVAVLLMASVARGLQQGWEIWELDGENGPEDDGTGQS